MYECFCCRQQSFLWDDSYNSEDLGYLPGGIIHVLHCTVCGVEVMYFDMPKEDEEDVENNE